MLPTAFVWTVEGETPEFITLRYRPNPNFDPSNIEARVMGAMAGEMTIARNGNRIRTLRGALSHDVKIGFGIPGKMFSGRNVSDRASRSCVRAMADQRDARAHDGHALLFKTIGQQEDEVKTEWKPSPAKTLGGEEYLRTAK